MTIPELGPQFEQPPEGGRRTTCGPSVLVMARMINDPVFAGSVITTDPRAHFIAAVLAMHRRTNALRGAAGWQLPWPRRLGILPWDAAVQMNHGCGVSGTRYRVRLVSPLARAAAGRFDQIVAACAQGQRIPLFIGDNLCPRHVILTLTASDQLLTVYDPSTGGQATIARTGFVAARFEVAGWHRTWFAVLPH